MEVFKRRSVCSAVRREYAEVSVFRRISMRKKLSRKSDQIQRWIGLPWAFQAWGSVAANSNGIRWGGQPRAYVIWT